MRTSLSRLRHVALPVFAALLLSSCDTVGSDSIFLTASNQELTFSFDADDITPGTSSVVVSTNQLDLGPFLEAQGALRSEVIGARIEQARLDVIFPVQETLSFLDEATLELGGSAAASQTDFPSSDRAALTPNATRDIGDLVAGPAFPGRLRFQANRITAGESYQLRVTLTIEIELEGV